LNRVFLFILFLFPTILFAQAHEDSIPVNKDSLNKFAATKFIAKHDSSLQRLIQANYFLNTKGDPIAMKNIVRKKTTQDIFFSILLAVALLLAFFRFFYARYFNNLFRVFFNTSLRQSQLTDQLLQAKLPSLLFNLFFIITGGIYVYFLLRYFDWVAPVKIIPVMLACVICLGAIYFIKFIVLKFTGWLTGFKEVTNTYLFIIFLINKIVGILLVPVIIILAFSEYEIVRSAVLISLLLIGLLLLLRFFRSYGLLQNKLKVSHFQFFLYIVGIEVVPLLLIYKGLMILLSKNL